ADVDSQSGGEESTWAAARAASPIQGHAWEMMKGPAWYNAGGTVALLFLAVIWLGMSDAWRSRLHLFFLLLLIGGVGALVVGSWHGGEMIYRHGVGVDTTSEEE